MFFNAGFSNGNFQPVGLAVPMRISPSPQPMSFNPFTPQFGNPAAMPAASLQSGPTSGMDSRAALMSMMNTMMGMMMQMLSKSGCNPCSSGNAAQPGGSCGATNAGNPQTPGASGDVGNAGDPNNPGTTGNAGDPAEEWEEDPNNSAPPAKVWGDPHFVGFEGDKYDVQGKNGKIYNILSDKNIQYNAKFTEMGKGSSVTIISEAGIKVGKDKVSFNVTDNVPAVNGVALKEGEEIKLDGGSASWDGKALTVKTPEYKLEFEKKVSGKYNYMDMKASLGKKGVFADNVAPHGLLGQTADGDGKARTGKTGGGAQGEGAIEGDYTRYEVSDLFADDFDFNRFGALSAAPSVAPVAVAVDDKLKK